MTYISLGFDCEIALMLNKLGKRTCSLPFDWVITYGGVSEIIKNNFHCYLPMAKINTTRYLNEKYSVLFIHNIFPRDCSAIQKRAERFDEMLKSTDPIIFIRKSHNSKHHEEFSHIKNDINDIIEFDTVLKIRYPNLKYTIHLILDCDKCYNKNISNDIPKTVIIHRLHGTQLEDFCKSTFV